MHNRILLYSFIGLITLASLGGVQAYSLFQNLCFPLANGTPCINWTGSQYEWTNITIAGDGNNYPTTLSVNQTNGNYTIQLGRNGLSTLQANFVVNSTGGASGGGITGVTINNGTGINVSGNGTTFTIGVANLQACNSVTEYSVWNGSHWLCDNDGTGGGGISGVTVTNPDTFLNLSTNGTNIAGNINFTSFDARYVLRTIYDAFTAAIYTNVTATQAAISVLQAFDTEIYTNVTALQARPTGNITGSGVTNYVARWTNGTNLEASSINQIGNNTYLLGDLNVLGRNSTTDGNYTMINLFNIGIVNDTNGASSRMQLNFWNGSINANNRLYSITTHDRINSTTEHPSHISHYALLKNNSYAAKFMEVLIGTDTDRKIYLGSNEDTSYIDRIVFPESVTGFYSNETDRRKGIESVASQYVILLDSDGDQSTDSFLLAQNNEDTVIIGTDNNRRVGINTLTPSFPLQVLANGSGEQKAFGLFNNQITTGSAVSMVFGISSSSTYSNEAGMITVNRTNSPTSGDADMIFKIRTSGTTTDVMTIDSMARVGINTTSPSQLLEVIGNANITGILYAPEICLNNDCRSSWSSSSTYGNLSADQATNGQVAIFNNQTQVNGSQLYYNFSSGRFGVATITPQQRMEVVTNSNTDYSMIRRSSTSANDVASLGFAVTTSSSGTTPQAIISYNRTNSPTSGDGDITFSSRFNAAVNEVFRIKSDSRVGVNTSSPTQTLHVQGGANITGIIYTPQLCLNGDCRTSWGSSSGGGNFSEFRVSNTTSTTTLYNNSLLTIQAGSNVVVDQTAGTFTISASVTGGSGNVSGNGTSGYVGVWNSANTLTTANLQANNTRVTIGGTTPAELFLNGYNQDPYALPYATIATTEFCEVGSVNNGAVGGFRTAIVSSGVTANVAGTPEHPCVTAILDSTTANGGAWYMTGVDSLRLNGTENTTAIWKRTSNTKPGQVTARHGFHDTIAITEPTDGCYWQFNFTIGTNVAYTQCRSNSVNTVNTTTFTPVNDTWYITNVEILPNAAAAIFRAWNENGTLILNTTISTNIPVAAGRETGAGFGISENNTAASSNIGMIDYMDLKIARRVRNIPWLQ